MRGRWVIAALAAFLLIPAVSSPTAGPAPSTPDEEPNRACHDGPARVSTPAGPVGGSTPADLGPSLSDGTEPVERSADEVRRGVERTVDSVTPPLRDACGAVSL